MKYKVDFVQASYIDIKEARDWYRKINPELSKRFAQQLKITIEQVSLLPTTHAIRYKDVRIANMAIFPYAIHFILETNRIVVLAVHHTAIDPRKWAGRF